MDFPDYSVVYFIQNLENRLIKIGYSRNLKSRLKSLGSECGRIQLLGYIKGGSVEESRMHDRFWTLHYKGEWFQSGRAILDYIQKYCQTPEEEYFAGTFEEQSEYSLLSFYGELMPKLPDGEAYYRLDRRTARYIDRIGQYLVECGFNRFIDYRYAKREDVIAYIIQQAMTHGFVNPEYDPELDKEVDSIFDSAFDFMISEKIDSPKPE